MAQVSHLANTIAYFSFWYFTQSTGKGYLSYTKSSHDVVA